MLARGWGREDSQPYWGRDRARPGAVLGSRRTVPSPPTLLTLWLRMTFCAKALPRFFEMDLVT